MFPFNFNNQSQFMRSNFTPRPFSPITPPRIKSATRLASKSALGSLKKFSVASLIDTSSKAINTFNSFIPIYNEMKPLMENSKNIASSIKKFLNKRTSKKDDSIKKEVVEPEIVEPKKEENTEQEKDFVDQKEPNKPFFN